MILRLYSKYQAWSEFNRKQVYKEEIRNLMSLWAQYAFVPVYNFAQSMCATLMRFVFNCIGMQ